VGSSPAFPILPYNAYSYVVNHFNLVNSKKQVKKTIVLTKKTLRLVTVLHSQGVINHFLIHKSTLSGVPKYYITFSPLFYKSTPFFKNVRLVTTPSRKHTISLTALRMASHSVRSSVILLSTSQGIIPHTEALNLQIGGLILCILD
jgi:ribosomal protein S8